MKKLALAVVFLAIAGVLFAQEAAKVEKAEPAAPAAAGEVKEAPAAPAAAEVKEAPAAPAAAEVKEAPAATEGEFCAKLRKDGDVEKLGKCHKKSCKFFPKGNVKCFPTSEAAKAAGVASFCKICCKDLQ